MKPTTFVHLTDLHIPSPGHQDDHLHTDTEANFRAIMAEVRELEPRPDFIVVSGDLTNHGHPEAYARLKELWQAEAPAEVPVLWTIGNHDRRPGYWQVLGGGNANPEARVDHSAVIADTHIILLDTTARGRVGGFFEPGQLDWLTAELDRHAGLRKLIVMHHAPALDFDDPAMEWEALSFADTRALQAVLQGRRDVLGILSGHIHMDRVSQWYGLPVVVGIGQHNATDVVRLSTQFRALAGASFNIGQIRPSGMTITFAPQPSDRRLLKGGDLATMKVNIAAYEAMLQARLAEEEPV